MQTFLPFADFDKTAQVLDNRRLNKQRIETYQIMGVLTRLRIENGEFLPRTNGAWLMHPAVRMWAGYELTLVFYAQAISEEWVRRGFNDHARLAEQTELLWHEARSQKLIHKPAFDPDWIGNTNFHTSHQSNLLRKDIGHYSKHFPSYIPLGLPYIWPITQCPVCGEWGRTPDEIFHLKECVK